MACHVREICYYLRREYSLKFHAASPALNMLRALVSLLIPAQVYCLSSESLFETEPLAERDSITLLALRLQNVPQPL